MSAPEVRRAIQWLWWINVAKTVGAGLVAIGVAAEFLGEFASRPFERVLNGARQAEMTRLSTEAAAARDLITKGLFAQAHLRAARPPDASTKIGWPYQCDPADEGGSAMTRRLPAAEGRSEADGIHFGGRRG